MRLAVAAVAIVALAPACVRVAAEAATTGREPHSPRRMEFDGEAESDRWRIIGDRLMLGRSDGVVNSTEDGIEFSGTVRRNIGGGWCSARRELEAPLDLSDCGEIVLRVRGDGRTYGFDLRDSAELDGTYWEAVIAPPAGEWAEIALRPEQFHPLRRGSPASTKEKLDWRSIQSLAIVVAKGQTGAYAVEVDAVEFRGARETSEVARTAAR